MYTCVLLYMDTCTHAGSEVAEYCAKHMPELLQSNALYKSGDLAAALREVFVECDRKLLEKEAIQEMKRYGCKDTQGEEEENSRLGGIILCTQLWMETIGGC